MKGLMIISPLILVIVLGMALRATGFFDKHDRERLTKLLYWVVLPALLFRTTYLSGDEILRHKNLFYATYTTMLLMPLAAFLISRFATHRGDRGLQALSAMASFRANNIYLGLPAVTLASGAAGAEAASIYLAICLPGFNLISLLWGEAVQSKGLSAEKLRVMLKRLVRNPLIVFSLAGLLFAQLRIPLPGFFLMSLKLVSDMATGIALIALGMSLELPNLWRAFLRTWHDALIKLVLHPAMTWFFLLVWPVSTDIFQAAIIISAMPTAANTFIVAAGMGFDEQYACEVVAVTTVLAPVFIPLWVWLLGM